MPDDEVKPRPEEIWPGLRDRAEAMIDERPEDPARIGLVMHHIERLMLDMADYLATLNADRYAAERTYSKRRNAGIGKYAKDYPVTVARALAEADADPEKTAWDALKAAYHYAEDTQKALQTKHYGLMNVNKGMQSVMFTRGRE